MSTHGQLRTLVERYGDRVLRSADDLRATLDDFFTEGETNPGEINLLVDAVRLGALDHLLSMLDNGVAPRMAVDTAGRRLAELRGGHEHSSRWAVAVVGHALGRISEADVLALTGPPAQTHRPPHSTPSPAPNTQAPHTQAPHTQAPHTQAPHTQAPHTQAPPERTPQPQEPTIYRGAAAPPQQGPWPPDGPPRRSSHTWLWAALAAVVVAALVVGGLVLLDRLPTDGSEASDDPSETTGPGDDPSGQPEPSEPEPSNPEPSTPEPDDTASVTACESDPEVLARDVAGVAGGMTVTFELHATCEGGQFLDASAFGVGLADSTGDLLAASALDFSGDPLWVPDAADVPVGSTVRAYFPLGTFWAVPSDLADGVASGSVAVAVDSGDSSSGATLPAPEDPTSGDEADLQASSAGPGPAVTEQAAEAALLRQARLDEPGVSSRLEGRWVPQLSSKSYGLYDPVDDLTYDFDAIYRNHLQLRLQYPQARLLWSGDWQSYDDPSFWVTVAAETFGTGERALAWCESNGFPASQCYAKQILRFGSPEGTSLLQD